MESAPGASSSASNTSGPLSADGSQEEDHLAEEDAVIASSLSAGTVSSSGSNSDAEYESFCGAVAAGAMAFSKRASTSEKLVSALYSKDVKDVRLIDGICKVLAGPALAVVVVGLHFGVFRFGDAFDEINWWKCMVACCSIWVPLTALTMNVILAQWVHPGLPLARVVPRTALIGGVVFVAVWSPLLFLGKDLSYQPIPFAGYLAATAASWTMACHGWFSVPADHRSLPDLRHRLKATTMFNSQLVLSVLSYDIVLTACSFLCKNFTVIALPALHALLNKALYTLMHAVDAADTKAFVGFFFVHTLHIIFLTTYIVGASFQRALIATGIDLLLNLKYLLVIGFGQPLQTLLLYRVAPPSVGRAARALGEALPPWLGFPFKEEAQTKVEQDWARTKAGSYMVVTETNELLQPLLYFAVVYLVYHGNNADAMAGVGASEFGRPAMHGARQLWTRVALMIALDLLTCVMTAVVTRAIRINLFHFYLVEVEHHWLPMALLQVWVLDTVLCESAIGCFVDLTFKFAWMH